MQESAETVDIADLDAVQCHHHLCLLYEAEADMLTPVIPFIQKGVAAGERCVYLNAGADTLERVLRNALSGQKQDIGALKLLPVQETWLKGGGFDQARVMELLRTLAEQAVRDGFKGIRIICEMGWAGGDTRRVGQLLDLEASLNRFAESNQVILLCLYNRHSFSAEPLLELAKSHQHLVIGGKLCCNPLFAPADVDLRVTSAQRELELFLATAQSYSAAASDRERLRLELEQAYAELARKIYENWQEEDTLRASKRELHEKDEALLVHRRRVQTILQHLPAVLMAFDSTGSLAACNHEFERVTGFKPEEVMGKPMLELLQVEPELHDELRAAHPTEGGDYRGKEWRIRCKDGSVRSVSWFNISRYIQIPGWGNWVLGRDETPRINAEEAVRSLREELEARSGEVEALGYLISHDLGGEVARMGALCATLQELPMAVSGVARKQLQEIQQATREMAERIATLQSLSGLAAGLEPEEVDLSAIVCEIAAQLQSAGDRRRVVFDIEDGVRATGDRKLLRLAMEQLLENAWNYTIGVQHPVIQFGTARVEGELSYYVSDNGPRSCGRPGPQLPPPKPESAEHFSCGIGLATVQRIINMHRGRIWATDEAGKGGTWYFRV